jgi:bifunctional non-homologous end joining protein LigD
VAEAASALPCRRALLDGEVAVQEKSGATSFQALQNTMRGGRERGRLLYFVFDLLHLDGYGLRRVPLRERKRALARLVAGRSRRRTLVYSEHVDGQGDRFYAAACRRMQEGVISKLADGPYVSGRSTAWLKTKCTLRQEFVIGGYTDPQGGRSGLGALLLGVREDGRLRYAGRVGTGFDHAMLRELRARLDRLEIGETPFDPPLARGRGVHWVRPQLVGEVSFTQWTEDGRLRHPAFAGLREDKPAGEVVEERPVRVAPAKRRRSR